VTLKPRSYLYVPGDRPDMLAKATTRGADALIVDLEDAVAPDAKDQARRAVSRWLNDLDVEGSMPEVWVRLGPAAPDAAPAIDDLAVAVHPFVAGVVQAKCEAPEALVRLDDELSRAEQRAGLVVGSVAVVPLIESPAGVLAMAALAASPRVRRLQAGEADLSAALGMEPGPDAAELASLRWTLVVTSAASGLDPPVGPVETRLQDLSALRAGTEALRRQGFGARGALHPRQVPVINDVFTPSSAELERAAALVGRFEAAAAAGSSVAVDHDGSLIDPAVVRKALRMLARGRYVEGRSP
jgi:citrate lyase subunit beta/citryl-CoA lyase